MNDSVPSLVRCALRMCHYRTASWMFASTVDLWNTYTEMYLRMDSLGFSVKVIRYEDLVLRTEDVIEEIGEFLNLKRNGSVKVMETTAKNHGHSVGRAEAINKIRSRSWLSGLPKADLAAICERLDADLLQRFRYEDCANQSAGRKLGYVLPDADPALTRTYIYAFMM